MRRKTGFAITAGLATLLITAGIFFWLVWLSPWTYQRPASLPEVSPGPHQVFVYGTLRHASVRWIVYGRSGSPSAATLEGYERNDLDLIRARGASVEGLVLTVDRRELKRLDRYERLGIRYSRERVELGDGQQAWVYQRLDD
ncbi:gamma-glutamylcyclotransferase [Halomonas sp. 18H]|uniref:gamma-glutamylcyclotransferase family protein n=1 Tax=Halomonas almeriensis TaxID=308163 RepID=UPI00223027B6|nr:MULTISPECIES: gamma-glutamylcyclotransferase family protein [Halomonas]MCW4151884.1 gamma-glutamylcyclotransferase [Halomonas sp. 18H]MDN3554130.1 gamma-glutamylcyclotransferase family protein [Halomonas almeriensis]